MFHAIAFIFGTGLLRRYNKDCVGVGEGGEERDRDTERIHVTEHLSEDNIRSQLLLLICFERGSSAVCYCVGQTSWLMSF